MSKQTGLGQKLYVAGFDISGDIQSYTTSGGRAPIEATGLDKKGFERLFGRRDGHITAVTFFNPDSDRGHPTLKSLPLTDRMVSIADPSSGMAQSLIGKQGNYDSTLAADGALTCQVNADGNGFGLEHGNLLTPLGSAVHTGATQEASVDFGAAHAFGAQAYLQVTGFTGTDATVAIQSSSDNGGADAWTNVTDLAFTQVTGANVTERIQTARDAAIERYLRVVTTTTGGFSNLEFFVMVVVNEQTVNFGATDE